MQYILVLFLIFAAIIFLGSALVYILGIVVYLAYYVLIFAVLPYLALKLCFHIYEYFYYNSRKFNEIKDSIKKFTEDCNDLNEHIEDLKKSFLLSRQADTGESRYIDTSTYNFRRPELKKVGETKNTYNCSLTVLNGARQQPFKYICKYFNIKIEEKTLVSFEEILNNFSAAEEGKAKLKLEREKILNGIDSDIPFLIRQFGEKKLYRKLGFDDIDFSQMYFPKYRFQYISAGGNSSQVIETILDINMLERFIQFLSQLVKFRKSILGQRLLMTTSLREKIKERDNFSCRNCKNSLIQEPNLLLEIDHIIPLSKNGLTVEENLQTLCWRCNRSKGAKLLLN